MTVTVDGAGGIEKRRLNRGQEVVKEAQRRKDAKAQRYGIAATLLYGMRVDSSDLVRVRHPGSDGPRIVDE